MTGFPVPWQKLGLAGEMQLFGMKRSQNVPAPQAPAPGQHTPPSGAQLNLLGHRKKPGWLGHGGPDVAVSLVPGLTELGEPGLMVTKTTVVPPSRGFPASPPWPPAAAERVASAMQSAAFSASVALNR